jgi:magnesium chelatase family protein
MVVRVATVAFEGIEARPVDVQVQIANGSVLFMIVGLPDKAVGESRERVRAALTASGLALPAKRITVNLAPADLPKEGSHYDLPIALGIMAGIGAIPPDAIAGYTVLGELALDGTLSAVAGVLPAAVAANARGHGLICPAASGPEAAWAAADLDILAPGSLIQLANHFKGTQVLARPAPALRAPGPAGPDLRDVKGQESAKRALEIAAAGGHNLLMNGPPGAGKSMLAARLPSILPPLSPGELLDVAMIHSVAGSLAGGALSERRPFRAPHHSASMPALVGGGSGARPGEISLAHHGVLFLDELPEFSTVVLDSLRQPLETGEVSIARANHRVTYPARFQLVAAMNPCRCGHALEPGYACRRQPNERCMAQYQGRLSGPLLDRIDLHLEVPAVSAADLMLPPPSEGSAEVGARVAAARAMQAARYKALGMPGGTNAAAPASVVEAVAKVDAAGLALLRQAGETMRLTARGYHRVLKLARTLADLDGRGEVTRAHLAEALSYRASGDRRAGAERPGR